MANLEMTTATPAQKAAVLAAFGIGPVVGSIGTPGKVGFGVGICPDASLPSTLTLNPFGGVNGSFEWGNYTHTSTGSQEVFIPKFYYRVNDARNPTYAQYAPNDIDIRGIETFASTAAATAAGYRLHRAFIDGGAEKVGFFIDKYKSSKIAKGTGYCSASIKNGLALSSASDHNQVAGISSVTTGNINGSFVDAHKGRDSANGEYLASCPWHCQSVFQADALAKIALAHAQACTSPTAAAWFDSALTKNFPKGCNNNALRDNDDSTVVYQSDGYSNCGKTGSGSQFAKTTHNGQDCGVADVNGLMWEVLIGHTCIAVSKSISGVAKTNPVQLTVTGHGLTTGTICEVTGLTGPTTLNDKIYSITVVDANTITLDGVDGTGLTTWTSGGTVYTGTFYLANESVAMKNFTSGNTIATDHWGSTGVAANMSAIANPFPAATGGTTCVLKMGNGSNQVFAQSSIGEAGIPNSNGVSASGAALFGTDYYEMRFRNELCVLGYGSWSLGASTGVFARRLGDFRSNSYYSLSGRAACYPN